MQSMKHWHFAHAAELMPCCLERTILLNCRKRMSGGFVGLTPELCRAVGVGLNELLGRNAQEKP